MLGLVLPLQVLVLVLSGYSSPSHVHPAWIPGNAASARQRRKGRLASAPL